MITLVEGFDGVDATTLAAKWPGSDLAGGVTLAAGRDSIFTQAGNCLTGPSTLIVLTSKTLTVTEEVVIAAQVRVNSSASWRLFQMLYGSSEQMSLWVIAVSTDKWRIEVRRGTDVIATTLPMLLSATFRLIEFRVLIDPDDGEVEVRVDQVRRVLRKKIVTDVLGSGFVNKVAIGMKKGASGSTAIDDLVVTSTVPFEGYSTREGFLGDIRVLTMRPDADGTQTQWTPSAGTTHHDKVDDATFDADATIVSTTDPFKIDLFHVEDVATIGVMGSIVSVWLEAYARGLGGGTGKLALVQKNDVVAFLGVPATAIVGSDWQCVSGANDIVAVGQCFYPWTVPVLDATMFGLYSSE